MTRTSCDILDDSFVNVCKESYFLFILLRWSDGTENIGVEADWSHPDRRNTLTDLCYRSGSKSAKLKWNWLGHGKDWQISSHNGYLRMSVVVGPALENVVVFDLDIFL